MTIDKLFLMKLTHYTSSIETIIKILNNGFAWVPNKRGLIQYLIPFHDFSTGEPQQFGMISFTELSPECSVNVRNDFGDYGIIVSNEWAVSQKIQKVLYIDNKGPLFESLQNLFQYGYGDLICKSLIREDMVSPRFFTNKAISDIQRAYLYSKLLQIYEYMEPLENSYQQEWRIANPDPLYGFKETKQEVIKNISPPKGWAKVVNLLKAEHRDIMSFVCPESEINLLKSTLPKIYKNKLIIGIRS